MIITTIQENSEGFVGKKKNSISPEVLDEGQCIDESFKKTLGVGPVTSVE